MLWDSTEPVLQATPRCCTHKKPALRLIGRTNRFVRPSEYHQVLQALELGHLSMVLLEAIIPRVRSKYATQNTCLGRYNSSLPINSLEPLI